MAEQLAFISRGAGGNLHRYTEKSGVHFQFKTGHSFYRSHRAPDGSQTDLRASGLQPDEVETGIAEDILAYQNAGGSLPRIGRRLREPLQRQIFVAGHLIAYRAVELFDGTVSVGTYFAMA